MEVQNDTNDPVNYEQSGSAVDPNLDRPRHGRLGTSGPPFQRCREILPGQLTGKERSSRFNPVGDPPYVVTFTSPQEGQSWIVGVLDVGSEDTIVLKQDSAGRFYAEIGAAQSSAHVSPPALAGERTAVAAGQPA